MKNKSPKGEASFDSSTRKVKRYEFKPIPPMEREQKLLPGATVEKASGRGKLPFVKAKFELLNTAEKKGGKNRTLNHAFFLLSEPWVKGSTDQAAPIDGGDGIVAYAQALGAKFKCKGIRTLYIDKKGNERDVVIMDPDQVKKFLEATAGKVHTAKTKNEKDQKDETKLWPKIDFFVAKGEEDSDSDDEEEEDEETEETDEDSEESDDDEEGDDEDDDEESEDEDDDEDDEEDSDDEDEEGDDDDEEDSDDDEESDDDDEEEPVKKKGKKVVKKATKKGKK